jgi:hypothetical protein
VAAYRNLSLGSEYRFLEFQGDVLAQIGSALSTAAASAASSTSKKITKPEEVAKNIAEILKNAGIKTGGSRRRAAYASVPESIIEPALLLIGQNRVGFAALLKFLLRIRIVGIAVRVILQRELAVRALDLNVGSRAVYAEYLVIVTFAVGCRNGKCSSQVLVSGFEFLVPQETRSGCKYRKSRHA